MNINKRIELRNDIDRLKKVIDECHIKIMNAKSDISIFEKALQKKRNELHSLK